jgi:RNA-directed DNA polymerase
VFERYADDAVVHCDSEAQARRVLADIAKRMRQVGLDSARDQRTSSEEDQQAGSRWRLHRWIYQTFSEVARTIIPVVAGWMQYYGRFYPSALYRLLARINAYLVRWIRNKYRRYDATRAARRKLTEITSGYPRMFRHWRWVTTAW